MSNITTSLIKQLRETSGAGMMDCKSALQENSGDFDKALDWLRKKGIAKAAKKSARVASEGLIAIAKGKNKVSVIELNSETDFVAKNEAFQTLAKNIAEVSLTTNGDIDHIKNSNYPDSGKNISDTIVDAVAKIGENLNLRRSSQIFLDQGALVTYVHNAYSPNLGKIGVAIALNTAEKVSGENQTKLEALGKQIAMHIAAAKPISLNRDGVDSSVIEREKDIFSEQARNSGKPDNIIEKMVEGRIRKFYEEVVLLDQTFIMDNKSKISEILENSSKEIGTKITISDYIQFTLGEGVEKEETDFAAEVAAAAAG